MSLSMARAVFGLERLPSRRVHAAGKVNDLQSKATLV